MDPRDVNCSKNRTARTQGTSRAAITLPTAESQQQQRQQEHHGQQHQQNSSMDTNIVFRTRGKKINPADCHLVYNGNEIGMPEDQSLIYEIERIYNEGPTKNFKLLGVLLDEYLTFDDRITNLCLKISKSLFCLSHVKNFVT
jgi:hypothetical protein